MGRAFDCFATDYQVMLSGTILFVTDTIEMWLVPPSIYSTASETLASRMTLSFIEKSLLLAAYYRGGCQTDAVWSSNSDQIVTVSLFYTGDISSTECVRRFET